MCCTFIDNLTTFSKLITQENLVAALSQSQTELWLKAKWGNMFLLLCPDLVY